MEVKYQIFVSSTFTDLIEERRSVIEMILNLGHIPVGMEAFQASDDTQWEYIKRRIDQADYYVVIVAERYGSELKGKSYTQMEYEYAVKQGVPVAAFLLHDAARAHWPNSKTEPAKRQKVEKFRKLCQKKMVKHWQNHFDLAGQVALALPELMRDKPRTGWVRADTVPSRQVLTELSKLSEERRRLASELDQLRASTGDKIPSDVLTRLVRMEEETIWDFWTYGAPDNDQTTVLNVVKDVLPETVLGTTMSGVKEAIEQVANIQCEDYDVHSFVKLLASNNLITVRRDLYTTGDGVPADVYMATPYGSDFLLHAEKGLNDRRASQSSDTSL